MREGPVMAFGDCCARKARRWPPSPHAPPRRTCPGRHRWRASPASARTSRPGRIPPPPRRSRGPPCSGSSCASVCPRPRTWPSGRRSPGWRASRRRCRSRRPWGRGRSGCGRAGRARHGGVGPAAHLVASARGHGLGEGRRRAAHQLARLVADLLVHVPGHVGGVHRGGGQRLGRGHGQLVVEVGRRGRGGVAVHADGIAHDLDGELAHVGRARARVARQIGVHPAAHVVGGRLLHLGEGGVVVAKRPSAQCHPWPPCPACASRSSLSSWRRRARPSRR